MKCNSNYCHGESILQIEGTDELIASPEKRLFFAIIAQALFDAGGPNQDLAWEALDFLLGERVNSYLEMVDVEPSAFKENLRTYLSVPVGTLSMKSRSTTASRKRLRRLQSHYLKFKDRKFPNYLPRDLLYKSPL